MTKPQPIPLPIPLPLPLQNYTNNNNDDDKRRSNNNKSAKKSGKKNPSATNNNNKALKKKKKRRRQDDSEGIQESKEKYLDNYHKKKLKASGLQSSPLPIPSTSGPSLNFARSLASPHASTRHRTSLSLSTYLTSRPSFTPTEMAKVCRALFYCLWLADGRAVQDEVANVIARLVHDCGGQGGQASDDDDEDEDEANTHSSSSSGATLGPSLCGLYLGSLLSTVSSEWAGVDQHRVDKFYNLLTAVTREAFKYAEGTKDFKRRIPDADDNDTSSSSPSNSWPSARASTVLTCLLSLCSTSSTTSRGPAYHVTDVLLSCVPKSVPGEVFEGVVEGWLREA
eukprot:CAMPEP_0197550624 /NCGR_PEP_ID=MMETSP1320-20131121/4152_1 /TAXON_ID=91990 /ORGANISM="Bolidomonas sp., Strain RCC2347" /LENGTH=338 /DNA_ID=CAMNT_0043111017 /DNA_START=414 /DNA_END=1427 /DNA_ORIENTATION=-